MLFPTLLKTVLEIQSLPIPQERIELLQPLLETMKREKGMTHLHFICTHNSRRSILAQAWAAALSHHHGLAYTAYSGGTEDTAFHPHAVAALRANGFEITSAQGNNPRYAVRFSPSAPPLEVFSKKFNHPANPNSHFIAIMTCSDAETNCPFIPGATARFGLRYEDPKIFDSQPNPLDGYLERSLQIGSELNWIFSQLASPKA